jgi:RNA polymerase sigma-70 factor (ECF subfamily)
MQVTEDQLKGWMTGGLDGDAAAHEALLRALVPLLRSFYRRFYRRRLHGADDDVEDLVQETLISIHTRRTSYDRDRPFTAWMYAIARYRLIDHLRRRRALVPIEEVEAILIVEGFEDATSARLDVEAMLATLSPKQARAIQDTHFEGLSVAEAAARAGIGESDVKVSVHRGLKALAARIKGERP